MIDWGGVAQGAAGLYQGYLGLKNMKAANEANKAAMDAYLRSSETLAALTPPDLMQFIQPYQEMLYLGKMTPEQVMAQVQKDTEMAGIKIPQQLLDAQYKALGQVQQVAAEGGLTAVDRGQLEQIKSDLATQERGQRQAIQQNMQERGVAGGGSEMVAKMMAQQGAAQRGSQMGFDVASQAQKRALDAMQQSGNMAGQMRTQDFNEQSAKAQAQDAINRFNTSMRQQSETSNVEARNRATADDLARRYALQEFNIGQRQRENAARLGAAQQEWNNRWNQATGVAGRDAGFGNFMGNQANQYNERAGLQLGEAGRAIGGMINKWAKPDTTVAPGTYTGGGLKVTPSTNAAWGNPIDDLTNYKYKPPYGG